MKVATSRWSRRRFLRFAALGTGALLLGRGAFAMANNPRFPLSDHCDGRRFFNPRNHINRGFGDVLKWKRTSKPHPWPAWVELTPQRPPAPPTDDSIMVTWVNHATFLLQTRHGTWLTDPIWSDRAGPFGFGPRRVHAPGVRFEDLPKIDAVLLSHDHYDHCDLTTLRRLAAVHAPLAITPLGNGDLLRRGGFKRERIIELDWWQEYGPTSASSVTLTPARHWSNRVSGARNGRLWGGFFARVGSATTAWFVGDTGYDDQLFGTIRSQLGAPDLSLIPIGAYEPRWFMAAQHCNPAEAVLIHREVGARQSVGMHWGCWQLTDEAREEPLQALAAARDLAGLRSEEFRVLAPGGSIQVVPKNM